MSFTEWLGGALEAGEGGAAYVSAQATRTSIIRAGLDFGESPTAILNNMRANGLGMRTQNFYGLVKQLKEAELGGPQILTGTTGATVPPEDILKLEGGSEGQYMVNVRMYYSLSDEEGDIETGYRTTSILQDAVDVDRALSDAQDIWNQSNPEGYKLGTLTGQEISSVSQWQG